MGDAKLAHKVCEKASDYELGLRDEEFCEMAGGIDQLRKEMFEAVDDYFCSVPQPDCRDII